MTAGGGTERTSTRGPAGSSVEVDTSGAVVQVAIHGDLDATTSGPIVDAVVAAFAGMRQDQVVVDMSDAGFVDSTGLGSLVRLRIEARSHGARTSLVGLDPRLSKLLRLTGLEGDFSPN